MNRESSSVSSFYSNASKYILLSNSLLVLTGGGGVWICSKTFLTSLPIYLHYEKGKVSFTVWEPYKVSSLNDTGLYTHM